MGIKEIIRPFKPQNWLSSSLFSIGLSCNGNLGDWTTVKSDSNKSSVVGDLDQLKFCLPLSSFQVEEKCVKSVKKNMAKGKAVDQRIRNCGRGRGRRKGQGIKRGNSSEKEEKQGKDNGSGRNGQNGDRRRGGGTGSGGNGDDRRRKEDEEGDDDEDDENEENEEESNDGENEDEEKEEDETILSVETTGNGDSLQELLHLFPPKRLDCNPPELPATPGTPVTLHGVVLHETSGGLVVLNVRWRNKLYSGALIDVKKNRWSSSRIRPDPLSSGSVSGRSHNGCHKLKGKTKKKEPDPQSQPQTQSQPQFKEPSLLTKSIKRPLTISNNESADIASGKKARLSPPLIVCPEPNCGKKYKHMNGLKYHQAHAHLGKSEDGKEKTPDELEDSNIEGLSKDVKSEITDFTENRILQMSNIKVEEDMKYVNLNCNKSEEANTEDEVVNVVETSILDGQDFIEQTRSDGLKLNENIISPNKSTPEIHIDRCGSPTSPRILVDDRMSVAKDCVNESTVNISESYNLSSLTVGDFSGYAQYSPTLASLNPQVLNNSLSNALQSSGTVGASGTELSQNKAVLNSVKGHFQGESAVKQDEIQNHSQENLSEKSSVSGTVVDKIKAVQTLDVKEEIVPCSPTNEDDVVEMLPGTLELLLMKDRSSARMSPLIVTNVKTEIINKEEKTHDEAMSSKRTGKDGNLSTSDEKDNNSSSTQERDQISTTDRIDHSRSIPTSFSMSLYQQIAQEGKYFPMSFSGFGFGSMTGDLATPSEIQKAVSSRHFSPMLLSYLNNGSKNEPDQSRGADNDGGASRKGAKASLDSKSKEDSRFEKKIPPEEKQKDSESSNMSQLVPSVETGNIGLIADDTKSSEHPLLHPGPILVPNITAGRPISRPICKPGSITGGLGSITSGNITGSSAGGSIISGMMLQNSIQQASTAYKASSSDVGSPKKLSAGKNVATISKVPLPAPKTLVSNKNIQGSICEPSKEQTEKLNVAVTVNDEGLSYIAATSVTDRSMIEAKTWHPKEVYRQHIGKNNGSGGVHTSETDVKHSVATTSVSSPAHLPPGARPVLIRSDIGMTVTESLPIRTVGSMLQQNRSITSPAQYPVPIAPAPSKQTEKGEVPDQVTSEHSVPDGPHIARFTLTREKKLVPSPAESRGRPRKIRVERTQQVPVGNAKGATGGRGSPSEQRIRKQTDPAETSVRASVISHSMQGDPKSTIHGIEEKDNVQIGMKRLSPVEYQQDKRARSIEPIKEDAKRSIEQDKSKNKQGMIEARHYKDESLCKSPITLRETKQPFVISANSDKMKATTSSAEASRDIRAGPISGSDIQMQLQRFETSFPRLPLPFNSMHSSIPGMYSGLPIPHPAGFFGAPPGLSAEDSMNMSSITSRLGGQPPDLSSSKKQDCPRDDKNPSKSKHITEHYSSVTQSRSRPPSREEMSPQMGNFLQKSPWTAPSDTSAAIRRSPDNIRSYFRPTEQASPGIYSDRNHRLTPQNRNGFDSFKDEALRDFNPPYGAPFFSPSFASPRFPERTIPVSEKELSSRRFMDPNDGKPNIGSERFPTPGQYVTSRPSSISHDTVFGRNVLNPRLSSNLYLTKADGAILGPLQYGSKPSESKR